MGKIFRIDQATVVGNANFFIPQNFFGQKTQNPQNVSSSVNPNPNPWNAKPPRAMPSRCKLEISKGLWRDTRQVSFLIEPVLMAEDRWSPLYDDVMQTGITV